MRRIIFYCGHTTENWSPLSINRGGIGGSETAVVEIAKRFAADGWRVDVYGSPGADEGEHGDVGYWDWDRLGSDESADVLVGWRNPAAHELPVKARARLLWLHDWNGADAWTPHLPKWDRVLGVSATHRDFLAEAYGLPRETVGYVPNGIDLGRFDPTIRKIPFSAIYASSPDRGLLTLLDLWPKIAGDEPTALLTVAYGLDSIDAMIRAGRRDYLPFRELVLAKLKSTHRVEYVGRLPQDELAKRYCQSVAWTYPSDFCETNCISAAEAMAGGCIPVCSSIGATKETVGNGGLVVYGPGGTRSSPYSPAWRDYFVRVAQGVLFERTTRLVLEAKARERAKVLTWDNAYAKWQTVIAEVLGGARQDTKGHLMSPNGTSPERELVAAG